MYAYAWAFLAGLLSALALALAREAWWPGLPVSILQWMWLAVAIGYLSVLVNMVRAGAIFVPPQTVHRHRHPVFFWIVAATHAAVTIAAALIFGFLLLPNTA